MSPNDIRAELHICSLEFESALNQGISHSELLKIYKNLKELQYKYLLAEMEETKYSDPDMEIIN